MSQLFKSMSSESPRPTRQFHYRWQWHLQSTPEMLWPLVADTNRFNRDTGVPSIQRRDPDAPLLNARRRLRLFRLGVPVEWEEEPFEWVRPECYGVLRRYRSGPVAELRTLTELEPHPQGGTLLTYNVWASPRNLLGLAAIPVQVGILSARAFDRAIRRYDQTAMYGGSIAELPAEVRFAPRGEERLQNLIEALIRGGANPKILDRLERLLRTGDAMLVGRLRPYSLADQWGFPRREVLETFLVATRRGLLEFEWDVLCPLCRNVKHTGTTLNEVAEQVHCDMCNIDFEVNFDQAVELTFHPSPSIREVEHIEYCIAGPQTTPHVVVQQLLQAGEGRTIRPALENGRYRLRTLNLRGGEFLQVSEDQGAAEITLRASRVDGWPGGEHPVRNGANLRFKNATDEEQLFILERLAWGDQAVTAADVIALQVFRDLFASEALRPGQHISVGSMAIIFTDLRGSTRLYNQIGDAPAFGLVMSHFDLLRDAVQAEGGAVVKTIGDAIMAVFRRPAPALRAMIAAQQQLAQFQGADGTPLKLRVGIHYGPCIAVTLNGRLDYFGSVVNKAARLEGLSSGDDVIISNTVRADPEVDQMLQLDDCAAEAFETQIKGFDDHFALWRVLPNR
jgi:class 3 adenylate cyclase